MIEKFTIYGERCSGTNYLENLIKLNFDAQITWQYGWKHFFGFQDEALKKSDDVLFVCIVRDLKSWINSFYRMKYHLPLLYMQNLSREESVHKFLNEEFFSFNDNNGNRDITKEIMEDRNIYTGKRYKNIFELRHTKIKYMVETLPFKVKNFLFIRYEDLTNNFENIMMQIRDKGLRVNNHIKFPLNTDNYKNRENEKFNVKVKLKDISDEIILKNPNLITYYETKLGYI